MKFFKILLTIALLGGIGYGGHLAWDSEALRLKTIEVLGNSHVSGEELRTATGLRRGAHLVKLSTSAVQRAVASIPWIASARVERIIPSKIRITVSERKPFVLIAQDGKTYLVDRNGVVLDEGGELQVILQELPAQHIHPGSRIASSEFRNAVKIMEDLPVEIRQQVAGVKAPSIDQISIELKDATNILYGAAEDRADKNDAIVKLWESYRQKGQPPALIDVRVPSRPAVRPR